MPKPPTPSPSPGAISTLELNRAIIGYRPGLFLVHSFFVILVFGLQIIPGLVFKAYFDTLENPAPSSTGVQFLWLLVAIYLLAEVARVFFSLGLEWYGWSFRLAAATMLRLNLFTSILKRPGDRPLPVASGEAINRFRDDIGEVTDFPTWLPDQLGKWIAAAVAVGIMASINLPITLLIFLPLIGVAVVTRLTWGKILVYSQKSASATDAVTGFIGQVFDGVQAIKVADAEERTARRLEELNEQRSQAQIRLQTYWGILNSLNSSLVTFGIGMMLLAAGQAIRLGTFSVGDFALFTSFLWFTTQVPSELGTFYGDYKTQQVSIERMLELVRPAPASDLLAPASDLLAPASDLPAPASDLLALSPIHPSATASDLLAPASSQKPGVVSASMLSSAPSSIEFTSAGPLELLEVDRLSYRYPVETNSEEQSGQAGIEAISFQIRRGEFVVVTGRVGSGKSTLVRSLIGLLPKTGGQIRWNGLPVEQPGSFFRPPRCAYLSQTPRLFSDTLKENILQGIPEDQADVSSAIHLSVMEEDLLGFEHGLDTLVGSRGVRLSGGQVQRVAAARLFVRQPELMVFDDLSSALDVETERLLWERLAKLRAQRAGAVTCLAVSHRKAAFSMADRILVLKNGQLESSGSLDDLLISSPEMQRLWKGEIE